MAQVPRVYDAILARHFAGLRQMAFVSGPRQVGKTTVCRQGADTYLNWDSTPDRQLILAGQTAVADRAATPDRPGQPRRRLVFDEMHKNPRWKHFLKGFFDTHGPRFEIIVTGSARLDIYVRGGDSLMGRYFPYRMHPFSVAECARTDYPDDVVRPPAKIKEDDWAALLEHGGFPEPFLARDRTVSQRWRETRLRQVSTEDLRDLGSLRDVVGLEHLLLLLQERSATQLNYTELAGAIQVSSPTIKSWVGMLEQLHQGFRLTPWSKSISLSLRKEPKWFLRDWSGVADPGRRTETFVACHLLKAVEGWTDVGLGSFKLHYLRDKRKQEVDFVVIRDGKPWMLVEVKSGQGQITPALRYFQAATKAPHAFQLVMNMPYEPVDCFAETGRPFLVPARTLLSQLL